MTTVGLEDWPRDFHLPDDPGADLMFLGTTLHWVHKALHPKDAQDEDILIPHYFIDRPDPRHPNQNESFETQRSSFLLAERSRGLVRQRLSTRKIDAFWLGADGAFLPVRFSIWGRGRAASRHLGLRPASWRRGKAADAALRRFGLADSYFVGSAPDGQRLIYVRRSQAAGVITKINPRASNWAASVPENLIISLADGSAKEEPWWPLEVAIAWVATRNMSVADAALRYPSWIASRGFGKVAAAATATFLREQIATFYCHCRRAVCTCWKDAAIEVGRRGRAGDFESWGYRSGIGGAIPFPEWHGAIAFGEAATLSPPAGVPYDRVTVNSAQLLKGFSEPAHAPPKTAHTENTKDLSGLALAIYRERLRDRKCVKTVQQEAFEIHRLWDPTRGRQPTERRIREYLAGLHTQLKFVNDKVDPSSADRVREMVEQRIAAGPPRSDD